MRKKNKITLGTVIEEYGEIVWEVIEIHLSKIDRRLDIFVLSDYEETEKQIAQTNRFTLEEGLRIGSIRIDTMDTLRAKKKLKSNDTKMIFKTRLCEYNNENELLIVEKKKRKRRVRK